MPIDDTDLQWTPIHGWPDACHRNRRKFLSMFTTVSGFPGVPGKNQSAQ